MKVLLCFILVVHGLIHLLGFAKAFKLAPVPPLVLEISRPTGALWLLNAALLVTAGLLLFFKSGHWWLAAAPAVVISQTLVLGSWSDAKFGTVANLLLMVALVPTLAETRPGSFSKVYQKEVAEGLDQSSEMPPVKEEDLAHLPALVKNYLRRAGVVGKPQETNFHAVFTGSIRSKKDGGWMKMTAEQHNFYGPKARIFYMKASRFGIPFDGLHVFKGPKATMKVRIASWMEVVNAEGKEMNQSETVTLFNDMCLLAPGTLIGDEIQWESTAGRAVKARFTHQGITISAELRFNEAGDLVDFISEDRFQSADGRTHTPYRWSTPVGKYRDFGGRRVFTEGEALWHPPEGGFSYGKFVLQKIEYNRTPKRNR